MSWFKKQNEKSNDQQIEPEVIDMMGLPPDEASPTMIKEEKLPDIKSGTAEVNIDKKDDGAFDEVSEQSIEDDKNNASSLATEVAVKDIIAKEGDKILEVEDSKQITSAPKKENELKRLLSGWWHNKKLRDISFLLIFLAVLAVALIPQSRYYLLNTAGVTASMSLSVIDAKSGRPIKNVEISVGGQSSKTGSDGKAILKQLRLGKSLLVLEKRSFAAIETPITVGWGSNPYESPFQLEPVGVSYNFKLTDWLSGQPIEKAEVSDGESTAVASSGGVAELTIEPQSDELALSFKAAGYRTEKIKMDTAQKEQLAIKLVAARPSVFVSKRSGKYDLYKKDADGKNESVIFAANGNEQSNIALLSHPSENIAAFVSTREGKRNKEGYLLSNLYIVDVSAKTASKAINTEAEKIQLIDWIDDRLIFVKIVSGPSGNYTGRQKVMSYDYKQDKMIELASANYFNDVEVIKDQVFVAPSATKKLIKIDAEGKSKDTITSKEVWTLYRTSFGQLVLSTAENSWLEYILAEDKVSTLPGEPPSLTNKTYINSPGKTKSAWIDSRDGKGVLIVYDMKTGKEKTFKTISGLQYPLRWLSDKHILYRVISMQETADYVVNIEGGDAKKVNDATSTESTNRWYYY